MAVEIIYCAGGNRRFAEIARDAGFLLGSQLPKTVYLPIYFADQNWRKPDREVYLKYLAQHRPHIASVLDLERHDQLPEVLAWAEDVAQYVEEIMIIPKAHGSIARLPRTINGKAVRLGYSVPTRHGGTAVAYSEFAGWPVHLLGGSPQEQMRLAGRYKSLRVVSADSNMHSLMATRFCAFFDPHRSVRHRGYWPTIRDYDGQVWGDGGADADAPQEAFRRSCENIMAAWRAL